MAIQAGVCQAVIVVAGGVDQVTLTGELAPAHPRDSGQTVTARVIGSAAARNPKT